MAACYRHHEGVTKLWAECLDIEEGSITHEGWTELPPLLTQNWFPSSSLPSPSKWEQSYNVVKGWIRCRFFSLLRSALLCQKGSWSRYNPTCPMHLGIWWSMRGASCIDVKLSYCHPLYCLLAHTELRSHCVFWAQSRQFQHSLMHSWLLLVC